MSGTYPGSMTYPGPATYPGAGPPAGSATLTLTADPVLRLQVVQMGAATLILTVNPVLRLGGPTQGFATLTLTVNPVLSVAQFGSISANPSLAGQPDSLNFPPRVLIQASNITGPTARVVRYDPSGQATPVRSGDPAPLNSGSWIGYDYEAPYNVPVYYVITPADGSAAQVSPPVTLAVTRPWLVHPGVPSLSQPVTVKVIEDETMTSSGALHQVLGRNTPIPVTDGRRKAAAFTVQIKTATADDSDALDQLFYDTAPLLLQVVYPQQTTESVYRWVYIGDITRARKTSQFGDPSRVWTLPCTQVSRPVGRIQSQRTWADVMAECATWADVLATYGTWRGVLTGIPGV